MTSAHPTDENEAVDWDDVFRSLYASELANSSSWFATADELWIAAELVAARVSRWWDLHRDRAAGATLQPIPPGCHAVFMMLCGYVVENYTKGALASRLSRVERQSARASGLLPGRLKSHDLVRLAMAIDFEADMPDHRLLRRLQRAVQWHGRYPVAVGVGASLDRVTSSTGETESLTWLGGRDVENSFGLLNRLQAHVGARRFGARTPIE